VINEEKIVCSNDLIDEEIKAAVKSRCIQLMRAEEQHPGFITNRCNNTNKSSKKYFRRYFRDDPESKRKINECINYLENLGGYCNCEILYNVVPKLKM